MSRQGAGIVVWVGIGSVFMGDVNMKWALAAACGLGASIAGCDQSSPTSRAVGEASRSVAAVSVAESAAAPEGVRNNAYSGVADKVKAVPPDAVAGERSAAMLLSWTAHAALAEGPAQEAENAEGAVRLKLNSIEQALSRWAIANSLAASLEAFDPSAELERLSRAAREKEAELAKAVQRRAELESRLADLEKRAGEKLAQAEELQGEYSRLMATTTQMSAAGAAPVVERANRSRVRAEQARLEAGRISAEADLVRPQFREADAVVAQLTSQRASINKAAEDLRAQAARSREEAQAARAAAAEIAREIRAWVGEADAQRRETLIPAYEKALDLIGRARTAARESAKEPRSVAGRTAVGGASLAAAELHWQRAAGAQVYLSTLQSLTRVRPALPESEEYGNLARKVRDERKESLAAATSAIDEAIEAFRGVPASGQVKERLEELARLLEDARKLANDERLDASSPLAPPAWLGIGSGAGSASPARTLERLLELSKAGKGAEALDLVNLPSPQAREKLRPFVDLGATIQRADKACKDKFGKAMAEVLSAGGGAGAMLGPMLRQMGGGLGGMPAGELENLTPESFAWNLGESRATATREGMPMPLSFVKVGDEWKLDIPGIEMLLMQADMAGAMIAPMNTAFAQWAQRVEAGEFADADAAGKALGEAIQPVLEGMMGGMGR